ncbi:MAG: hypothetical protein WC069_04385 [Candidatus Shapirobacteria bacterium]
MADEHMKCAYHYGIGTTYLVKDYYIYGKIHRVALCHICEGKLKAGRLAQVPDHFMPEHRLQAVDDRIRVRDGS